MGKPQILLGIETLNSQLATKAYKSNSYISISDYSVYFSDNDWSIAIKNAMNDIKNNGGGVLVLDALTYNCKSNLVVPDGVRLQGAGRNSTILKLDPSVTSGCFIDFAKNVTSGISNLKLKGNNTGTGLKLGLDDLDTIGVVCNGLEVYNIEILNFYNGLEAYRKHWVYNLNNIIIRNCTNIGFKCNCTDNNFSNFWISQCPIGLFIGNSSNKFINFKIDFCGTDTTGAVTADASNNTCLTNIEVQCSSGKGYTFNNCYSFLLSNVYSDQTGNSDTYIGNNAIGFSFTNCHTFVGNGAITENTSDVSKVKTNLGIFVDYRCYDMTLDIKFSGLILYAKKQIEVGAYTIKLDNTELMASILLSGYNSIQSTQPTFNYSLSQYHVADNHGSYVQNGDGTITTTVISTDSLHRLGIKALNLQQNHTYVCYCEVDTNVYKVDLNIINTVSPYEGYLITTYKSNSNGLLTQYGLFTYKQNPTTSIPYVYLATQAQGNDTFTFKNLMILDVTNIIQSVDMDTIVNVVKNNIGLYWNSTKAIGASSRII